MKVGVIGLGSVGSAVRNGFESKGLTVKTYDKFKESDGFEDVAVCDFIFICVPTPSKADGSISLSAVDEAIGKLVNVRPQGVVIIKSTVIPGTAQGYQNKYPNLVIVSNPEFLTQSTAEYDFLHPDKIVIGYTSGNEPSAQRLASLYQDFRALVRIVRSEEAEMAKYMINSYYAARVVFANEIYDICKGLGVDYEEVRRCFELDKRVACGHFDVFHSGYRGVGGGCLLKDLSALISKAEAENLNPELLKVLRRENERFLPLRGRE